MSAELYLKFKDENGEAKRILVDKEKFTIGRTPENSLKFPSEKLSRKHAEINRYADIFVLADCDSSNGTTLNGEDLNEPKALKNGDRINFGGGLKVVIELNSDEDFGDSSGENPSENNEEKSDEQESEEVSAKSASSSKQTVSAQKENSSVPFGVFLAAPILGILALFLIGGLILFLRPQKEKEIVKNENDFIFTRPTSENNSDKNSDSDDDFPTQTPIVQPSKPISNSNNLPNTTPTNEPTIEPIQTPKTNDEDKKIQINSALFLHKIADSDTSSFLTTDQVSEVKKRISGFKGSSGLSQNLKSIKANAGRIQSIAAENGLKPQFLATAVLAKLGNQQGDVVSTANSMSNTLSALKRELAGELADESLLIIAGYEQGVAGDFKSLRTTTEVLSRPGESEGIGSRQIRTIWFLRSKKKINDSQYDFALRFLAIGTITQNPKDFNVNTDAVVLN
jgi:hypothetical protein